MKGGRLHLEEPPPDGFYPFIEFVMDPSIVFDLYSNDLLLDLR